MALVGLDGRWLQVNDALCHDVATYRAKERGGDRWAQVEVSRSASSTSMRVPNPDAPLPT